MAGLFQFEKVGQHWDQISGRIGMGICGQNGLRLRPGRLNRLRLNTPSLGRDHDLDNTRDIRP